jgi:hypothetical protein
MRIFAVMPDIGRGMDNGVHLLEKLTGTVGLQAETIPAYIAEDRRDPFEIDGFVSEIEVHGRSQTYGCFILILPADEAGDAGIGLPEEFIEKMSAEVTGHTG